MKTQSCKKYLVAKLQNVHKLHNSSNEKKVEKEKFL